MWTTPKTLSVVKLCTHILIISSICTASRGATGEGCDPRRLLRAEPAIRVAANDQDERDDPHTVSEQKLHIVNGGNRPRLFRKSLQR